MGDILLALALTVLVFTPFIVYKALRAFFVWISGATARPGRTEQYAE